MVADETAEPQMRLCGMNQEVGLNVCKEG